MAHTKGFLTQQKYREKVQIIDFRKYILKLTGD